MADLPISGLPAITVVSDSYLLAAVSESVTAQMTVKQVGDAYSSSLSLFPYTGSAQITGSLGVTGSVSISGSSSIIGGFNIRNFTAFGNPASVQIRTYAADATTNGAWYSWGREFLQMGPINSGTDATFTMAFIPADNYTGVTPVDRPSLYFNTSSQIYLNDTDFRIYSPSVKTFTVERMNTILSGSLTVSGSRTNLSSSLYIQSSSVFYENTASALVSYDTASGQVFHTPYSSALPALFAAGGFYYTGSITTTANESGSFPFSTSLGINSVHINGNGTHIVVDKAATYNFQFSIQVHNGPQAADIAIWLKKNGSNVADTATYVTVPSNDKNLIALNLWDTAAAGDYYEIAYQSDRSSTLFETIAATGNIPQSPAIILTLNQIR